VRVHHALAPDGDARPLVLAIGFFDGVHRGHREILRALLRLRRPAQRTGVLTFSNHPSSFLRPGSEPPLITTLEERVTLLGSSGVDDLYLLPFDAQIATLPAEDFVRTILIDTLRVRALAIGENFRFGSGRAGDAALARELLAAAGAEVEAVPPVMEGDERVSSTRVRAALARGDVAQADLLLGAPYSLRGAVVLGEGRGHALGFPTANVAVPANKTLPADGVYAAVARYDGRDYRALVSIGSKPTFGGGERVVEAWLRDFRQTIYGKELALRDLRFVREQRAFATTDDLLRQMQEDATHVQFPSFALI
jgi:riboflavin kinase / FMN adenylyltransferase